MSRILRKCELAPKIYELVVEAPRLATKGLPGQFVIVMSDERAERIPLTIADSDQENGTITIVLMVVGASSAKIAELAVGDHLYSLMGPLGRASEIDDFGAVIMVAGGVGVAPIYPIAEALHRRGNRVLTIQGARSSEMLFWVDKMAAISDEHIVTTDDGSLGRKGLVTEPLKELLEDDGQGNVGCVYAIGPAIMMKFCAATTRPYGVKTIVSLNTIMVDGTGMCGGCRVQVGDETLFTCVDGPEFDGHQVQWDTVLKRQRIYHSEEQCSLNRYLGERRIA